MDGIVYAEWRGDRMRQILEDYGQAILYVIAGSIVLTVMYEMMHYIAI